jgi:MraZ protein
MLWGSFSAKIDEKSRLRLPAKFRHGLAEKEENNTYFVTSDDGKYAQIYPISVWEKIAQKLQEPPRMNEAKQRFQRITGYFGLVTQMDPQGRIMISQKLRDEALISGDVIVIGATDHLEVWNEEAFRNNMNEKPLSSVERSGLADLGI